MSAVISPCGQYRYQLRSTNPDALWDHPDPVGHDNDDWLATATVGAGEVICAWGANAMPSRVREVVAMLTWRGAQMKCLGTTKDGHPRHPLYVRGDQPLIEWSLP